MNCHHAPAASPLEGTSVPTEYEAGLEFWEVRTILLALLKFGTKTVHPIAQSLYVRI